MLHLESLEKQFIRSLIDKESGLKINHCSLSPGPERYKLQQKEIKV